MERFPTPLIAAGALILVASSTFTLGYVLGDRRDDTITIDGRGDRSEGLGLIADAYEQILSSSVEPPAGDKLARGAIRGMVRALNTEEDPYAFFYTPGGYRAFQELTTGMFSGIGVWLRQNGPDVEVATVLPRSPALESGLQQGDVIRSIDGKKYERLTTEEAVVRIKGRAGTEVTLGVERDGQSLEFTIARARLDLPNLMAKRTRDGFGYIRLVGFARGAAEQLRDQVEELRSGGAEGLVLDLRDNGGGLFTEALDVASTFIEDGDIVTYREKSRSDVVYEAEGNAFEEIPLVVLINEGTASASEIVAGALQDSDRALLVGARSYGKGSVQQVFSLKDQSALKLTTAAYLTPSGRDIDGSGIEPDVEVEGTWNAQKQRAVEILRGIVLSTTGSQS